MGRNPVLPSNSHAVPKKYFYVMYIIDLYYIVLSKTEEGLQSMLNSIAEVGVRHGNKHR